MEKRNFPAELAPDPADAAAASDIAERMEERRGTDKGSTSEQTTEYCEE
jgi:hypothetical protein